MRILLRGKSVAHIVAYVVTVSVDFRPAKTLDQIPTMDNVPLQMPHLTFEIHFRQICEQSMHRTVSRQTDGTITNDDHEKSEIFTRTIVVFGLMITIHCLIFRVVFPLILTLLIVSTSSNVLKQLKNLKVKSSEGDDGIQPFLIRILPTVWRILYPRCIILF